MPPFLPVMSISRSQSVRLGRGPGNQNVPELNSGDTPVSPQSGALIGPFYADLGNPFIRRDYQRHQALGALIDVGATSNTVYSDLFAVTGLGLSAGTGLAISVAAGIIQSRFTGAQLPVAATTLTPTVPAFGGRTDLVVVNAAGVVSLIEGAADLVAPTYEVDTITITGTPTGGTFNIGFSYNGYWFAATGIVFNATAAAVATAMSGATGGPNNETLVQYAPGAVITGSGGALPGTAVTLTASAGLEGPITNQQTTNLLTGGTTPTVTFARATPGVGQSGPMPSGGFLVLGSVYIPSTATAYANYTVTTNAKLTA